MSKSAQPHDLLFGEVFSRKNAVEKFSTVFLPANVVQKMKLHTLRPEPTSYVPPRLRRLYADLVYSCQYGEDDIDLCLIKEHKSTRPHDPHFQLLDYVVEKWRLDRKRKRKRTPVLCILIYHGKEPWTYKKMRHYVKGMDDDLASYNPLFEFVLVDLNNYSDAFIESLNEPYLSNALLLLKHNGDSDYVRRHFERIFIHAELYEETDEGVNFMLSIMIYIVRTTDIREDEIVELVEKSPKIKSAVMKTYNVWDYVRDMEAEKAWEKVTQEVRQEAMQQAMPIAKQEVRQEIIQEVKQKILDEKNLAFIRKGLESNFTPEFMAEFCSLPLQKVKEIIARLKAEEKNGHQPA